MDFIVPQTKREEGENGLLLFYMVLSKSVEPAFIRNVVMKACSEI